MSADGDLARAIQNAVSAVKAQCDKMVEEDIFPDPHKMLDFLDDAKTIIEAENMSRNYYIWWSADEDEEEEEAMRAAYVRKRAAMERLYKDVTIVYAR